MGLINSIGAYFNKFLGGWTFGTQTDQLTMKNSAEIVGTTGTIYEHTFQNKNGIVAHLDDITISLPTDITGSILFLDSLNQMDTNGALFNYTTNGLFVKGVSAQNVLTLLNNTNSVLLSVENSGILNVGTSNINLLQNTGIENDLLYFDIANGRIGIGTSTPQTTLSIRSQGTNSTRGLLIEHTDNTTAFSHAKIIGSRSRGSHGSPSAVLANDSLVSFNARGYKATGWSDTVGGMYVYASENWTNTNTPTYITFRGVPSSSTTPTEWARLNSTGLGIGVSPTASLHVKGVSDTVGNVFVAQNLSNNEIFRLQNDRDIVIGGGSASADTQVTINPFRAPATTNFVLQVNAGTNNFMRFINSPGSTTGGLYISRDATSIGRYALSVGGAGGTSFVLTSNGSIGINTATAGSILPAEVFNNGIINSNVAGKNGQYFLTAGTDRGFIFEHLGTGSFNTTQAVFQISKSLTDAGPGIGLDKLFEINGTYNFTNGTKGLIGINYNTTITALSGAHYGLLIRPTTLNGIGLGSTLPTANLQIKGSGTTTGSSLLVQNSSNVTNFEVLNSSASSIRIGVNNITTEIKGGGSVDPILTVLRGASGLSIQHSSGVPELTTISSSAGLQIVSADNTLINIGNQSSTTKIFVSSRAGATITDYNFMVRDNGSRGIAFYTGNQNFDRAIQSLHDNAATILKIQPYGGNIALGHGSNTPSATLHVKGNSDSVGNMFVAENLSNTANLTLANSGVSTFNFSTGGKVVIAGAVGSGDTLLEIRRTSASSGGFIFRSGNALSQEIYTTNGSMYLVTSADNSDIYFSTGNGRVFVNTALANMSGFNTGFQFRVGVQGGSILNRWLNFGHHANYGMILQAVQNGNTPAIDSLAINPYGGITTLCAELANSFVDVLVGSGTGMRVYRGSATNGVVFKVGNGLGFGLMIEHLDTTNASTWGDIRIIQSNSGFFSAGRITGGTTTKNHLYGRNYGALSSYNTLIGHYYNEAAGTERGILFSSTDTVSLPSIIQSVHSGATKELSLQYYGGNVSVGGIQPTALLDLAASTTSRASLRIRNGVAPSSPNDGDIWTETNDIKIRLNGVTYTLVKI